jgi:hypothetical protein
LVSILGRPAPAIMARRVAWNGKALVKPRGLLAICSVAVVKASWAGRRRFARRMPRGLLAWAAMSRHMVFPHDPAS